MKKEELIQNFEEYEFWDKLNSKEQEKIILQSEIKKYNKGEIIYSPDQKCRGIIKVLKGCCRIYILSEEGKETTLYNIYEGDVCTLSASCMMEEVMFDTFMVAQEDTQLILTNVLTLRTLMKENIYLENYIYKKTVSKFSELMWSMQELLFTGLDKRLVLFLIKEERNKKINITHEQIALQLGSAREVISRMLKKFENEEIIKLSRGKIEIIDIEKLKKYLQ